MDTADKVRKTPRKNESPRTTQVKDIRQKRLAYFEKSAQVHGMQTGLPRNYKQRKSPKASPRELYTHEKNDVNGRKERTKEIVSKSTEHLSLPITSGQTKPVAVEGKDRKLSAGNTQYLLQKADPHVRRLFVEDDTRPTHDNQNSRKEKVTTHHVENNKGQNLQSTSFGTINAEDDLSLDIWGLRDDVKTGKVDLSKYLGEALMKTSDTRQKEANNSAFKMSDTTKVSLERNSSGNVLNTNSNRRTVEELFESGSARLHEMSKSPMKTFYDFRDTVNENMEELNLQTHRGQFEESNSLNVNRKVTPERPVLKKSIDNPHIFDDFEYEGLRAALGDAKFKEFVDKSMKDISTLQENSGKTFQARLKKSSKENTPVKYDSRNKSVNFERSHQDSHIVKCVSNNTRLNQNQEDDRYKVETNTIFSPIKEFKMLEAQQSLIQSDLNELGLSTHRPVVREDYSQVYDSCKQQKAHEHLFNPAKVAFSAEEIYNQAAQINKSEISTKSINIKEETLIQHSKEENGKQVVAKPSKLEQKYKDVLQQPPKYTSIFSEKQQSTEATEHETLRHTKEAAQKRSSGNHQRTVSAPETPRKEHVEAIRKHHEHKRHMSTEFYPNILSPAYSNSSLDRYFLSLQDINRDTASVFSSENFEPIPEPVCDDSDQELSPGFWKKTLGDVEDVFDSLHEKPTSEIEARPASVTDRLQKMGIDLGFLRQTREATTSKHTRNESDSLPSRAEVDATNSHQALSGFKEHKTTLKQTSEESVIIPIMVVVCPECAGLNKPHITWCLECGCVLIGVDPVPQKPKRVRSPPKRRKSSVKVLEIEEQVRSPKSTARSRASSNELEDIKLNGFGNENSYEIKDNKVECAKNQQVFRSATPPGGLDKSNITETSYKHLNSNSSKDQSKTSVNTEYAKSKFSLECDNYNRDIECDNKKVNSTEKKHSSEVVNLKEQSNSYSQSSNFSNKLDLSIDLNPSPEPNHDQLIPDQDKSFPDCETIQTNGGFFDMNIYDDIDDETYRLQQTGPHPTVPSLELDLSGSDVLLRNQKRALEEQERQQKSNLTVESLYGALNDNYPSSDEVKYETNATDDHEDFLDKVRADQRVRPKKSKTGATPTKSKGRPSVSSKVKESIEAEPYHRHWSKSSIAWSSYNSRELKTRSSQDLSKSYLNGRTSSLKQSTTQSLRNVGLLSSDTGSSAENVNSRQKSKSAGVRPKYRPNQYGAGDMLSNSESLGFVHNETPLTYNDRGHGDAAEFKIKERQHALADSKSSKSPLKTIRKGVLDTYKKFNEMSPRILGGEMSMWECLPDEILLHIFTYLPQTDLTQCARVCNQFYRVAMDDFLWQHIILRKKMLCDEWLSEIGRHRPCRLSLIKCQGERYDGETVTNRGLRELFINCGDRLQELNFSGCSKGQLTGDGILLHVSTHCSKISVLDASWCNVSDSGVSAICDASNRLESLNLSGCQGVTDSSIAIIVKKHGKSLHTLGLTGCFNITPRGIHALTTECKYLKNLSLGQCYKLTDSCIGELSGGLAFVETLDLRGGKQIKDNCIRKITRNCQRLQSLTLANCPHITDTSVLDVAMNLPNIRLLDVSGCKHISNNGIRTLTNGSTGLEYIDLSSTSITHKSVNMLASYCSRRLEAVKVSFCQDITESSILKLARHCKRLRILHLYGCKGIKNTDRIKEENPMLEIEI